MSRTTRSRPASGNGRGRRRSGTAGLLSLLLVLAAVAVVAYLRGDLDTVLSGSDSAGGSSAARPAGEPVDAAEVAAARDALDSIRTAEPRARGDYERDEFGSGWVDTDDNGCSTRNDVLARDLTGDEVGADCAIESGKLDDPYTGESIVFDRDDPQAVQIDHVVPLSLAWRMGADGWDRDRRVEFANDPDNLLAADGPANMGKGDSGPGEWQPDADYHCAYAVSYVLVSDEYGLSVSAADRKGLDRMLDACPAG